MPRYTEADAREAVAASRSYSEALRCLGLRPAGGNHALFKKYVGLWDISTAHFDPYDACRGTRRGVPLEEVMVEDSRYQRASLKRRLFAEGIKQPICERCGQGEIWRGRRMAMILDHINGVPDDNRLENLQIVCPNCAATLDTHCGPKNLAEREPQPCARCGESFTPKRNGHRYCGPIADGAGASSRAVRNHTCVASSAHRTSSCLRRSRRRATRPSGASTASPTTRFASGSGSTGSSRRRRRSSSGARRDHLTR